MRAQGGTLYWLPFPRARLDIVLFVLAWKLLFASSFLKVFRFSSQKAITNFASFGVESTQWLITKNADEDFNIGVVELLDAKCVCVSVCQSGRSNRWLENRYLLD